MAKTVKLEKAETINGVTYEAGTVMSVSESIVELFGLKEYQEPKPTKKEKE